MCGKSFWNIRTSAGFLLILSSSFGLQAQAELDEDEWISRFTLRFASYTFRECLDELEQSRASILARSSFSEIKYEALRLVGEAIRVQCESHRLFEERRRLLAERERLLEEANRLESSWRASHEANPTRYPDLPGRDRSQQALRRDAATMLSDALQLENDRERLQYESSRLLRLAMAVDSGVQNDLLRRLLGPDPVPTG